MRAENCIDYVEIPVTDLGMAKAFFSALFGWSFEIWGDDYMSFNDGRFDGGFRRSAEVAPSTGVLLIFFSTDLERDFERVQELGATISEPIFPFPGGRRFHFVDPTGTEYAIWSAVSNPTNGE
jgi:predicted enzyme related to lactoylglutathione lyase